MRILLIISVIYESRLVRFQREANYVFIINYLSKIPDEYPNENQCWNWLN